MRSAHLVATGDNARKGPRRRVSTDPDPKPHAGARSRSQEHLRSRTRDGSWSASARTPRQALITRRLKGTNVMTMRRAGMPRPRGTAARRQRARPRLVRCFELTVSCRRPTCNTVASLPRRHRPARRAARAANTEGRRASHPSKFERSCVPLPGSAPPKSRTIWTRECFLAQAGRATEAGHGRGKQELSRLLVHCRCV